jgi:energy-converting hydrogenase Eha subunit A
MKKHEYKEFKKLHALSIGKIQMILWAVMGLIVGILNTIMGFFVQNVPAEQAFVYNPINIVLMPIIYAIVGFVSGWIGALIYNLIAKMIGGIKVKIE